jgi:CubicO group peptidase (beta-lactamase class C family)
MKATRSLLVVLVFTLIGCAGLPPKMPEHSQQGDYTYLKSYLTWLIEDKMSDQGVEGLSIAVIDDQQVVWSQGFGYADSTNKVLATPQTVYRVGSISKLFTDTLVMQLAEQGKLDIDNPLKTYLPDFSIKTRFSDTGPITPRNIMTHHSGLPGDIGNGMWTKNPAPFNQLVGQLKDDYVAYPPNTLWSYSNLGITLLGAMVEQVMGKDFSAYAEQQLLKPLGMANAKFSQVINGKLASKAYKNHEEKTELPLRDTPCGGLVANVLDMSQFMKMIFADGKANGQQLLKPETLKEMFRQQNANVPLDAGFKIGLGWLLRDQQNIGLIAEHGGATLFHNSMLTILPQHKLGVIVLANSPPNGDIMSKITNAALELAFTAKTGKQVPLDPEKPAIKTRALSVQELQTGAGQYATSFGYVKLTPEGDTLATELNGKSLDLVAREDGSYGIRYKLLGLIPIQPDELAEVSLSLRSIFGHDLVSAHYQGQTYVLGEKLKLTPLSPTIRDWLGEYEIINLAGGDGFVPEKCALRERDGFLMLEYAIPGLDVDKLAFPIMPISDQEAIVLGLGRGTQETIRIVKQNGKELVAYSGYLLQKK